MFSLLFQNLSRKRWERAISVGIATMITLYLLVMLVMEPLRALGPATDTVL